MVSVPYQILRELDMISKPMEIYVEGENEKLSIQPLKGVISLKNYLKKYEYLTKLHHIFFDRSEND